MEINEGSIQLRSWYCTGGIKGKEISTLPGQNVEGLAERKWQTPIIFRGQMKKKINGAWKWGSFNYPRRRREQTSITLEKKNPKKLKTVIQKACAEKREERMLLNVVKCALTRGAEWKASVEKVQLQHRAVLPASRRAFQLRWPSQSKRWINSVRPMIPLRFAVVAQLHALLSRWWTVCIAGEGEMNRV